MIENKSHQQVCASLRARIIELTHRTGHKGAHVGGALSLVELLAVLYHDVLNFDISKPHQVSRDRFILSKGHSALGLFAALESVGFIAESALNRFEENGCQFYKSNLDVRFNAFGFNVTKIDGHNRQNIRQAIASKSTSKPNAIIANTIKGKGVSFMENNPDWHHGSLSIEQYQQAISELPK